MLNLDPFKQRKMFRLHESGIRVLVNLHPEIFCKKYVFQHCRTPTPPLSILCALNAPISLLEEVYWIFPEASNSAFRMASGCGAKISILKWLVEKDPNAVRKEHPKYGFPLHQACSNAPLETVRFVYEQFPQALWYNIFKGNTPLHNACKFSSLDVVKFLVQLDVTTLLIANDKNETPVLHALRHDRKDIVSYLFKQYPCVSLLGEERKGNRQQQHREQKLPVMKDKCGRYLLALAVKNELVRKEYQAHQEHRKQLLELLAGTYLHTITVKNTKKKAKILSGKTKNIRQL
mmetsp:Transcript_39132/g.44623  ORF Transcript_39132/g.44623 Transcript_39132/m.44623 type:complete len:290 (+) Transcript_39132:242-1111(+)